MSNNQANTNTVSNRIKHSVFKSSTSSKSKSTNSANNSNGQLATSASLEINGLNKNSYIDSNDNGGFPIGAASSMSTSNSVKQPIKQSSNINHVNSINHASSSLKSSVKRLFSPISNKNAAAANIINNQIINNQIASLPSGADPNLQPSSTPLISTKKHQNSMRQQAPVANQMQQLQTQTNKSAEKSLEASVFSTKSDHLSTSTSSATSTLSTSTSGPNMTNSNASSLYAPIKSNNQESNSKVALKKKDNEMVMVKIRDDMIMIIVLLGIKFIFKPLILSVPIFPYQLRRC